MHKFEAINRYPCRFDHFLGHVIFVVFELSNKVHCFVKCAYFIYVYNNIFFTISYINYSQLIN